MRTLSALILASFISLNSYIAYANVDIADEMYITEHWISITTSYDIETKERKLGTLYRKFLSFLLTYEFYDPFDNKLAIARSKFFSLTAHFDIYDTSENFLGAAEEQLFSFFPTFDIYGHDGMTKLATASMNFWGTTFTIYDPITNQEMAQMNRSFFRIKNNWTFKITNKPLFYQKGIDSRVLMTVIAFQGDREYWESQNRNNNRQTLQHSDSNLDVRPEQVNLLMEKVDRIVKQESLDKIEKPDAKTLESIANELETIYKQKESMAMDANQQSNKEKLNAFVDYCLDVVQSNNISDSKKKAIIYLLKMRLEVGVN